MYSNKQLSSNKTTNFFDTVAYNMIDDKHNDNDSIDQRRNEPSDFSGSSMNLNTAIDNNYNHEIINMTIDFQKNFAFKPTFPPQISPQDLLTPKLSALDVRPSKPPNAFIIYRVAAVKELKAHGCGAIQMTKLSGRISDCWKQEPENVKAFYKSLAKEATRLYKEMFPRKRGRNPKRQRIVPDPLYQDVSKIRNSDTSTTALITQTSYLENSLQNVQPQSQSQPQPQPQPQSQSQSWQDMISTLRPNFELDRQVHQTMTANSESFEVETGNEFGLSSFTHDFNNNIHQPVSVRAAETHSSLQNTPSPLSGPIQEPSTDDCFHFVSLTHYHQEVFKFHFHLLHHGNPFNSIADAQNSVLFKFHIV
ncbi:hypothetical protein G9A89_019630 [Geosiphon pyriformis]|nr:hypothetical protein G9A89_019630 [Geosiphon pyriformis]